MGTLLLGLSLLFGFSAHAAIPVSDRIQTSIVQLYSQGNCLEARTLMRHIDLSALRPNVMAIAAYCEPENEDPEVLFARAEELNPTGDLILVLHAKYRDKKSPGTAYQIWEKVMETARNIYFRELAKEKIAGVLVDETKEKPLNLSPSTGIGEAYFAGIYKRSPQQPELAFLKTKHSYGVTMGGTVSYRHWYDFGSLGIRYTGNYENYGRDSSLDFLDNRLEVPLAFHLVTSKDLIFRPFFGYSDLDGNPYHFIYGMGMKAAVYTGSHVQSVQGIFYNDRIYQSALSPTQGAHYRFEFAWDFFPVYWTISTMLAVEHVSSTPVPDFVHAHGLFEMSHNDLSLEFKFAREFRHFELQIEPTIRYRADTNDSYYTNTSGKLVNKQREDAEFDVKTTFAIPVIPSVRLYSWLDWNNIYSNFGATDFANFNFHNYTVGLGLRASLSTY